MSSDATSSSSDRSCSRTDQNKRVSKRPKLGSFQHPINLSSPNSAPATHNPLPIVVREPLVFWARQQPEWSGQKLNEEEDPEILGQQREETSKWLSEQPELVKKSFIWFMEGLLDSKCSTPHQLLSLKKYYQKWKRSGNLALPHSFEEANEVESEIARIPPVELWSKELMVTFKVEPFCAFRRLYEGSQDLVDVTPSDDLNREYGKAVDWFLDEPMKVEVILKFFELADQIRSPECRYQRRKLMNLWVARIGSRKGVEERLAAGVCGQEIAQGETAVSSNRGRKRRMEVHEDEK